MSFYFLPAKLQNNFQTIDIIVVFIFVFSFF